MCQLENKSLNPFPVRQRSELYNVQQNSKIYTMRDGTRPGPGVDPDLVHVLFLFLFLVLFLFLALCPAHVLALVP